MNNNSDDKENEIRKREINAGKNETEVIEQRK